MRHHWRRWFFVLHVLQKRSWNEINLLEGNLFQKSFVYFIEPMMKRPKHSFYGSWISFRRDSSSASIFSASDSNISTPSWRVLQLHWRLLLTVPSDLIRRDITTTDRDADTGWTPLNSNLDQECFELGFNIWRTHTWLSDVNRVSNCRFDFRFLQQVWFWDVNRVSNRRFDFRFL